MCRDPSASEATMMRARTSAATAQAVAALVKQGKLPAGAQASAFYTNALIDKTLR